MAVVPLTKQVVSLESAVTTIVLSVGPLIVELTMSRDTRCIYVLEVTETVTDFHSIHFRRRARRSSDWRAPGASCVSLILLVLYSSYEGCTGYQMLLDLLHIV